MMDPNFVSNGYFVGPDIDFKSGVRVQVYHQTPGASPSIIFTQDCEHENFEDKRRYEACAESIQQENVCKLILDLANCLKSGGLREVINSLEERCERLEKAGL